MAKVTVRTYDEPVVVPIYTEGNTYDNVMIDSPSNIAYTVTKARMAQLMTEGLVNGDTTELKKEIKTIQEDIAGLIERIEALEQITPVEPTDLTEVNERLGNLEGVYETLNSKVGTLESNLDMLQEKVSILSNLIEELMKRRPCPCDYNHNCPFDDVTTNDCNC